MIHFCGSLTYTKETNLYSSWHGKVKALRPMALKIVDQLKKKDLISSFQLLTNSGPIMLFVPMNFPHQLFKQTKLFSFFCSNSSRPSLSPGRAVFSRQ